jgi:hypothetical protein
MTNELAGDPRRQALPRRFRWVYFTPLLALLALSAWVFASPIGASPDDDYHLASIWCANEARTDLCAPDSVNGPEGWRLLLPGITQAPCFVADESASGACQDWSGELTPSVAADHGNWIGAYPPLYYAAMNIFATTDIQTSALMMRFVNVVLYLAFMTALAWLLPVSLRIPLVAGSVITAVPLAAFLIASNNPGAWGVIGVGASWLAALGWYRSTGRRAWALGAMTVLAVLVAAGSRTDAAVYAILGLGIASFLSFERSRIFGRKLLLPAVLVIVAAAFFRTSGYAAVAVGGLTGGIPDSESRNLSSVLAFNVISIPQLWTGVFGSWGLGWRMEIWPGYVMVEFAALVVFIGLASLGLRYMPRRKAVMVGALVATLYLLPLYILTRGISVVGENVQPRYLVPLVVVLGGLLLLGISARPLRPGPWHVIPAIVLLAGANSIALYTNLRRYVTGFDVEQLSLGTGAEWWWTGLPIGPTAMWVFGSLAFTGLVVVLGIAWLRNDREREFAS